MRASIVVFPLVFCLCFLSLRQLLQEIGDYISEEEGRAEAKAAEAALMRGEADGPFFGVPIAIKDLVFVEGWPMTST